MANAPRPLPDRAARRVGGVLAEGLRRMASEEQGQDVVEWAGVLIVVAAIIAVVLTLVPSLTGELRTGVGCTIERIFTTQSCGATAVTPPDQVVCEASSGTNDVNDQLQVLFLQVGHDNMLIKTVSSNGEVAYTLTDTGSVSAQAKLLQLEAEAGPLGGFDIQATAAAGGQLIGSHTFTFPDQKTAAAFAKAVSSAGGWGVVAHDLASGLPGVGGLTGGLLNLVGIHGAPSGSDLARRYSQYLTGSYVGVGAVGQLNATAAANLGPVGLQLNAQLQAAGGAREITSGPQKGDVALYVSLKGNANAALLAGVFGPNASANANGTAVVTLDHTGRPVALTLTATGAAGATGVAGSATRKGSAPTAEDGEDPGGPLLKKLSLSGYATPGTGYLYTANVDLTQDPDAVSDLLGIVNPSSADQGLTNLENAVGAYGVQQVQPFQQHQSSTSAGVNAEVLDVGGGLSASQQSTNQSFSGGWIKPQGSAEWMPTVCQR